MDNDPASNSPQHSHPIQPGAREVAPHIWQITLPIPFALRTVNVYALLSKEGWTLIDTAMGMPDTRHVLKTALKRIGLDIQQLRTIILTHYHPDHVGLSGELQEQSGAPVFMHPLDIANLELLRSDAMIDRFGSVSPFLTRHGLPPMQLWFSQVPPELLHKIIRVPPPTVFTPIEDGQTIQLADHSYRVIWTPGHAPGQICLLREQDGVFLSADHVLPRITPNIGLYTEQDRPNPLGDYLASLEKVNNLPVSLVLPGHGEAFPHLQARCAEIVAHHKQRLHQLLSLLLKGPQHAYQLTERLFAERLKSDEARRMAVAEVLSHLEYLRLQGLIEQQETPQGIILYLPKSTS